MADPITELNAALAGRYRVERQLGEGGMATVYLADDIRHERKVALKVLRPELAAAIGPDRFLAEIRTTANLHHPHTLPLFDSGDVDGFLFYVMPYVEGETLSERLSRKGQLPVAEAVDIARKVASALHEAHERGIVHRDIKPANILLAQGEPIVADFGIALAVGAHESTRLTDTGMSIGTPAYMSPEQGLETTQVDRRSDIYSLGCVLYEMLAGDPPFSGSNTMALLVRKATEDTPRLRTIRNSVPAELERTVLKAVARTPADRFQTAAELGEALARVGPSEPSANAARVWAPAVLAGAVAVGIAAAALGPRSEPQAIAQPEVDDAITALAVLPFGNFAGGATSDLVSGLHGMLIGELHRLGGTDTRSRASVLRFANGALGIPEIARELDVDAVLEAIVVLVDDSLRVDLTLIRARPREETVWSGQYGSQVGNVFGLLGEIVRDLSPHLGSEPPVIAADERRVDPEALYHFAAGRTRLDTLDTPSALFDAVALFDSASAIDPGFARALAWESLAHSWIWWWGFDQTPERLALAAAHADSALALVPGGPEARVARGFAYSVQGELDTALEHYLIAFEQTPKDPTLLRFMGMVTRHVESVEVGAAQLVEAALLDPSSSIWASEASLTLIPLRAWAQVLRFAELAQRSEPVDPWSFALKSRALLEIDDGAPDRALNELRTGVQRFGPETLGGFDGFLLPYLATMDDDLYRALLAADFAGQFFYLPGLNHVRRGSLYQMRGDTAGMLSEFDSARAQMEPLYQQGRLPPEMSSRAAAALNGNMALVLAALGDFEEAPLAVRDWLAGEELLDIQQDAGERRARVLTLIGDHEGAIEELRLALDGHSATSQTTLRINPWWDPLRGDPGFEALLQR
ncbi:MAG: protein kinase [Gemmatimonadetes bacterium]|nr:protein kinase [Gemmatimonadota bacterium]